MKRVLVLLLVLVWLVGCGSNSKYYTDREPDAILMINGKTGYLGFYEDNQFFIYEGIWCDESLILWVSETSKVQILLGHVSESYGADFEGCFRLYVPIEGDAFWEVLESVDGESLQTGSY